jgi:hypothetical protein
MKLNSISTLAALTFAAGSLFTTSVQAQIVINASAWYDASDASTITTVTGGNVTNWNDKSGNGVNLVQATDGDRPSLVTGSPTTGINGLNVLEFAGRTEDMDAISNIDATWAAVVLQYNGTPGFATALGSQTQAGGATYTIQYRGDQTTTPTGDRWQAAYSTNGNPASTSGAAAILNSPGVVINSGFALTNFDLQIGGDRGLNNRGWDGYIAEVIYGNETLTVGEQDAVEGYLAHKWGFEASLVDGHAYKDFAPTDFTIVPEPSSFALLAGCFGLTWVMLRRRR